MDITVPGGDLAAYIAGRPVLLCYSGGKDSGACAIALREAGVPFTAVFCDTGWESALLYRYIGATSPSLVGDLVTVRAHVELPEDAAALASVFEARLGLDYSPMVRWILRKGLLPSRGRKWCTDLLKIQPTADYIVTLDDDVLVVTGVRAEESARRAQLGVEEFSPRYGCDVWRPILHWTELDVIEAHQRAGVPPCPLYLDHGAGRVGCWPCVNTQKRELRAIAEIDPTRIAILAELEAITTAAIAARAATRGEAMDYPVIGWFHGRADAAKVADGYAPMPIAKAVEWSRTSWGGRQLGMFAPSSGGCTRWGMCDAVK
jgi:3'-phosphoadenosine 5'-phosphosulfate sulfotransferase (PAPS reductase)/FAD synthetase